MLIHEIPTSGCVHLVGAMQFVRPAGAAIAQRLPDHVKVFMETDGTHSLSGPVLVHLGELGLCNCFLIHGQWYCHEVAKRAA